MLICLLALREPDHQRSKALNISFTQLGISSIIIKSHRAACLVMIIYYGNKPHRQAMKRLYGIPNTRLLISGDTQSVLFDLVDNY